MRTFSSSPAAPADRGEEFGAAHAGSIAVTIERYERLFRALAPGAAAGGGGGELRAHGEEALEVIGRFSGPAADEIRGLAGGAGVPAWQIGMLNARTEILGRLGAGGQAGGRGECSTVVDLRADPTRPVTIQTWDWHEHLADSWLVWTIEYPDGTVVHTLAEYGQLGKIGVNSRGVGIHLNILNHAGDGGGPGTMGVPIHVLSRAVLERCGDAGAAAALIGAAEVSASSVYTIVGASGTGPAAVAGAEVAPAGPRFVLGSPDGLYLHTNHFLDPQLAAGDRAPRLGPDSFLRLGVLRRALHDRPARDVDDLVAALANHASGAGSTCCHPAAAAGFGDRWTTLATISLDVAAGEMSVRSGGPCATDAEWHTAGAAGHVGV